MRYETGDALPPEWTKPLDDVNSQVKMSRRDYGMALQRAYQDGYEAGRKSVTEDIVWGDVRHHKERIEQLNEWVRDWKSRAEAAEAENRRLKADLDFVRDLNRRNAAMAGSQQLRADRLETRVEELQREIERVRIEG